MRLPEQIDYIIVGGGSAGCVLANRLSANPKIQVLVIEAGKDYSPGSEPETVKDSFPRANTPENLWPDMFAERIRRGESFPFEQARIIGGGSSVMGMLAMRGVPDDYDEWCRNGAKGWGWNDVLPYFRKLETDMDFEDPLHGKEGPIPIRRHMPDQWPPFCQAIGEVLSDKKYILLKDLNGEFGDGIAPTPMSNTPLQRSSAASAYLTSEVRSRPNLIILSETTVKTITIENGHATGVRIDRNHEQCFVKSREVILSAGAIHSPALLLASGVGPKEELDSCGVTTLIHRPGVGKNLQNHPIIPISVWLRNGATQSRSIRPAFQNCLRYSSGFTRCTESDMFITIINKSAEHPVGRRLGGMMLSVYKPYSQGSVRLNPRDPKGSPQIQFNLLSDERDLARLGIALRFVTELLDDHSIHPVATEPFIATNGRMMRWLNSGSYLAKLAGLVAPILLDGPTPLRRNLINLVGKRIKSIPDNKEDRHQFLLNHVIPSGHVAGSCRMGNPDDRDAVVDPNCRVIGIKNLRVVDCSIMPKLIRGNTNIPAIMIAEKAADLILHGDMKESTHISSY